MEANYKTPDRAFFFALGCAIILMMLFFIFDYGNRWNIQQKGTRVSMHIDSIRHSNPAIIYLRYEGQTYSQQLSDAERLVYAAGAELDVKYIPGNAIVVLPSAKPFRYLVLSCCVAAIGLIICICNFQTLWK